MKISQICVNYSGISNEYLYDDSAGRTSETRDFQIKIGVGKEGLPKFIIFFLFLCVFSLLSSMLLSASGGGSPAGLCDGKEGGGRKQRDVFAGLHARVLGVWATT